MLVDHAAYPTRGQRKEREKEGVRGMGGIEGKKSEVGVCITSS
jgi:hypothetical protein